MDRGMALDFLIDKLVNGECLSWDQLRDAIEGHLETWSDEEVYEEAQRFGVIEEKED